jgi:hypothetical protein
VYKKEVDYISVSALLRIDLGSTKLFLLLTHLHNKYAAKSYAMAMVRNG